MAGDALDTAAHQAALDTELVNLTKFVDRLAEMSKSGERITGSFEVADQPGLSRKAIACPELTPEETAKVIDLLNSIMLARLNQARAMQNKTPL